MKVGVFLSDQRMEYLADYLKKTVQVIEIDENVFMPKLKKWASELNAVIFPASGVQQDGFVRMKSTGMYVLEFMDHLNSDCVIFSGHNSSIFKQFSNKVKCWMDDDEVVFNNSQYTAEGLLSTLITTTSRSLTSYHVDIIGTGNCAKACAEFLSQLKINARFVSRAFKEGLQFPVMDINTWKTVDPSELIINTSPVTNIDQHCMSHWKCTKQVYDLATGFPCVDVHCLKHPFLKLYPVPAIPAVTAPESAALLIHDYLCRELGL